MKREVTQKEVCLGDMVYKDISFLRHWASILPALLLCIWTRAVTPSCHDI